MIEMKMTFYGRQPFIEDDLLWKTTSKYWKLIIVATMEDDLQWKTTCDGRRTAMEDELRCKTTSKGRLPPMEDDLQ